MSAGSANHEDALVGRAGSGAVELKSRRALALEKLALRQQLVVLRRHAKRPKLSRADCAFWVVLARVWPEWRTALTIVQLATVIRWHRTGFALYWRWKSRKRGGRPRQDAEIRTLIREMAGDNVGWGAPRIHGELLMPPGRGQVIALPRVGGLHHRYDRCAA